MVTKDGNTRLYFTRKVIILSLMQSVPQAVPTMEQNFLTELSPTVTPLLLSHEYKGC